MKKILISMMTIALVAALIGGGVYAWFSDTEQSTGNTLGAGTLDLDWAGGSETGTKVWELSDKAPGENDTAKQTLQNVGSLDGELDISLSAITNTESSGGTEYEGDGADGELGGKAYMAAYVDVDASDTWTSGDKGLKSDSSVYNFAAAITGTADSGTTTTLVDAALIQADDYFNGMILTTSGESRLITDFDQASNTITVASAFSAAVSADDAYSIANLVYATIDSYDSDSWDNVETMTGSGAAQNFYANWWIPFGTSADNSFQGDSVTFNITFTLEQADAD